MPEEADPWIAEQIAKRGKEQMEGEQEKLIIALKRVEESNYVLAAEMRDIKQWLSRIKDSLDVAVSTFDQLRRK